ncbi:MAG: hypothetical protein FWD18_01805 [Micrococcales bacterium]|nr:hypothetical protein [Micrococcales bacterium]
MANSTVVRRCATVVVITLLGALLVPLAGCSRDSGSDALFSDEDIATMSEFQRNILEDGVVTYAEYESAIIAERQCVQDAGFEVSEVMDIGAGQLGFTTEISTAGAADPDAAVTEAHRVIDACGEEYAKYVATAWAESQVITDPAERERLQAQFASCLKDAGLRVSADNDLETLLDAVQEVSPSDSSTFEAVTRCEHDASRLFAISVRGR